VAAVLEKGQVQTCVEDEGRVVEFLALIDTAEEEMACARLAEARQGGARPAARL